MKKITMDNLIGIIFLGAILLFCGLATYYLFANDFNKETLEVIFPVIGAIILSLYLGVQAIYLNGPELKSKKINVHILRNKISGEYTTLGNTTVIAERADRVASFEGLKTLESLKDHDLFRSLDNWSDIENTTNLPDLAAQDLILDLVEYTVLEWLNKPYMWVGADLNLLTPRILGVGGGGGILKTVELFTVQVKNENRHRNPFLDANENFHLSLPKGSEVKRLRGFGNSRKIVLNTQHSSIEIEISYSMQVTANQEASGLYRKIFQSANLLDNSDWVSDILAINLEMKNMSFSRHADQAKIEAKWFQLAFDKLQKDFSWEELEPIYKSP